MGRDGDAGSPHGMIREAAAAVARLVFAQPNWEPARAALAPSKTEGPTLSPGMVHRRARRAFVIATAGVIVAVALTFAGAAPASAPSAGSARGGRARRPRSRSRTSRGGVGGRRRCAWPG